MLSRKNRIEESVFVSGKLELWMLNKAWCPEISRRLTFTFCHSRDFPNAFLHKMFQQHVTSKFTKHEEKDMLNIWIMQIRIFVSFRIRSIDFYVYIIGLWTLCKAVLYIVYALESISSTKLEGMFLWPSLWCTRGICLAPCIRSFLLLSLILN